jgi:multidrug efflux pump subunit AcrA (membrane-fusion protein)
VSVGAIVVGPASSPASGSTERVVSAQKGVVQSTVSGTGNLQPATQLDLDFGATGTVTHVYVKAGDHVQEGDPLAAIDDTDAKVNLGSAQADLASAKAQLESAQAGASGPTAASAAATPPASSGKTSASGSSSATSTQSAASKAASIASAQAAVDKAQLSVEDAQNAVQDTRLRAPTAGTIASVSGAAGDTVTAGSGNASSSSSSAPSSGSGSSSGAGSASASGSGTTSSASSAFIVLAKLHRMQMTVSITESDIGKVEVGQSAVVSLSALSDVKLAAHVTSVAVLGSTSSGVVSYPVTLVLDQSSTGVKAGMSASAQLVVDQQSGVSVPSAAITGRGGSGIVQVRAGGKTTDTRVTTGMAGDAATIVLSGLKVGDQVVIRTTPAAAPTTGATGQGGAGAGRTGVGGALGGGGGGAFPGGGGFRGGGGAGGAGGGFARGGG